MHARRNAAQCLAAFLIPVQTLVWAAWPAPAWAGPSAAQVSWPATVLTASTLLAAFCYWKWRTDRNLQRSELSLEQARRDLLACQDGARELAEQAEQARQSGRQELERLEQALFIAEQRLDLHLKCASELVFALDLDGRLQQLSQNWCETLGIDAEKLIGQHHAWLVHPDDLPSCQVAVERALTSRSPQGDVEYRIRHAEGDWRWHAARIAPLSDANGRMVGLLGVARMIGEGPRPGLQRLRQAQFDALTALPGRGLCLDRLQQALRQAERHANRAALLLVELDDFRQVNERRGHAIGDLVLRECAARISASVRCSDTVGRGSGATFMVLLPDVGSTREALDLAHRIRLALREPLRLRNRTLAVTACIGVAVYPAHGYDEDELGAQAELALCMARQGGHDRVALPVASTEPAAYPVAQQA